MPIHLRVISKITLIETLPIKSDKISGSSFDISSSTSKKKPLINIST